MTDEALPTPEQLRAIQVISAKHFLPTRDAWGEDFRQRIYAEITVQTELAINAPYLVGEAQFDFLRTEWIHFDCEGPLTEKRFKEGRDGAVRSFAAKVNELEVFKPVRIFVQPPISLGVARFDWLGEDMPFDLRAVIDFGVFRFPEKPSECDNGLRFHVATLVQKGYGCAVDFDDLILGKQ